MTKKQRNMLTSVKRMRKFNWWSDFPLLPRNEWKLEVMHNETLLGYWDWVVNKITKSED